MTSDNGDFIGIVFVIGVFVVAMLLVQLPNIIHLSIQFVKGARGQKPAGMLWRCWWFGHKMDNNEFRGFAGYDGYGSYLSSRCKRWKCDYEDKTY